MSTIWVDLLGAEVQYYDAGGIRTRCFEAGRGEPLVLLHGSGGHAEAFSRNVIPLSDQFRVCAVNMLGHGFTGKPAGRYSAPEYADHVVRCLDAAGIDRAHLAGESLGGWVACWTALRHPDRVRKVVSITGAGIQAEGDAPSPAEDTHGADEFRRLNRQFAENPTKENLRARLAWLFHDPSDVTDELLEVRWRIYQQSSAGPQGRPRRRQRGHGDPEYVLTPERLRALEAPLLFLWTEFNPAPPASLARRVHAQVPGSEYVELKNCAHWPQWEDPAAFNRVLREFLAR